MKSFKEFLNEKESKKGKFSLDFIKDQVEEFMLNGDQAELNREIEDAIGEIDYDLWLEQKSPSKHPDDDYPDEAGECVGELDQEDLVKLLAKKLGVKE